MQRCGSRFGEKRGWGLGAQPGSKDYPQQGQEGPLWKAAGMTPAQRKCYPMDTVNLVVQKKLNKKTDCPFQLAQQYTCSCIKTSVLPVISPEEWSPQLLLVQARSWQDSCSTGFPRHVPAPSDPRHSRKRLRRPVPQEPWQDDHLDHWVQ